MQLENYKTTGDMGVPSPPQNYEKLLYISFLVYTISVLHMNYILVFTVKKIS